MIERGYQCKECGAEAVMADGQIVRSCQHTGTVLASLSATVSANGGLTADVRGNFLLDLIGAIMKRLRGNQSASPTHG